MPYTPNNNPYIPGDPYSYDLKWLVEKMKKLEAALGRDTSELPYFLESTNDDTDRTTEINRILHTYGACQLGEGRFLVSNIVMPEHSSLSGAGIGATWLESVPYSSGDMIAMNSVCSVKDLRLYGGLDSAPASDGGRNGISWAGSYEDPSDPGTYPLQGQISNVLITGFSGDGIRCEKSSRSANGGVDADNIIIRNCYCGIFIGKYSEYNQFVLVDVTNNHYGCINNGGNNVFVNGNFSKNYQGLLMDDTGGVSPNNSHGSFIGCSFNHADNNTGIAIEIKEIDWGEIFSACQIHFGSIVIQNSKGIRFDSCILGSDVELTIEDNTLVTFDECTIYEGAGTVITAADNTVLSFNECYDLDGTQYSPVL